MTFSVESTRIREDGFTLVELLVVILIVGILTSIAVPAFLNQRKAANDAALKSDMKNVATQYQTWANTHTNQDFRTTSGSLEAMYVVGDGADFNYTRKTVDGDGKIVPTSGQAVYWNDVINTPKMTVSPGNVVEIVVRTYDTHIYKNAEDQFCLTGSANNSSYTYVMGSYKRDAPDGNYSKNLYYDSMNGGLRTIEELDKMDGIETSPCAESVKLYRAKLEASGLR